MGGDLLLAWLLVRYPTATLWSAATVVQLVNNWS